MNDTEEAVWAQRVEAAKVRAANEKTAKALVDAFDRADSDVLYHYAICDDQDESKGCDRCARLTRIRWNAEKAMKASDDAWAHYNSPQHQSERRLANHYFREEIFGPEDD